MLKVIKIGGNVIDNEASLQKFCRDFAALKGPKLLVHGGGVMASRVQEQLGVPVNMVEGRRVTDAETIKVVTMVYAGWASKHIAASLQSCGCNAMGLAGCDGSVIKASRRAPKLLSDGCTTVDYGLVGDVTKESVNVAFLKTLLDNGITPVLCAISHDGKGNLLNTNADTIASSVASALGAELIYCFEKDGVLMDKDDPKSIIKHINPESYAGLKTEGKIVDGMIPKLDNAFSALRQGSTCVRIKNADALCDDEAGTEISLQ
jgi:acetylglutamate kinase